MLGLGGSGGGRAPDFSRTLGDAKGGVGSGASFVTTSISQNTRKAGKKEIARTRKRKTFLVRFNPHSTFLMGMFASLGRESGERTLLFPKRLLSPKVVVTKRIRVVFSWGMSATLQK